MSKRIYSDCMWDHCSDIARCPCCEKDDRITELQAKLKRARQWRDMPDEQMRLQMGELSAQDIRNIRAALKAAIVEGDG